MRDRGHRVWTYRSDDGKKTQQVYNQYPGVIPDFIAAADGTVLSLDPASPVPQGASFVPPAGMKTVMPFTPEPDLGKRADVQLGWPGQVQVN